MIYKEKRITFTSCLSKTHHPSLIIPFLTESKEISNKDAHFLSLAEKFYRWIKKNLKNQKYEGYEKFLVTENTINWLHKSKGELLLNNIL
ncbi:MAG: hypothetical protein H7A25_04160 [Leptospiraceae bacterium]|nr:hypothetical protein [Leptospiraceae bacterium]MCP5499070.1 hypothetical protein [Leptospiraceae bacterium]